MVQSIFEVFKISLGPSSSHTTGPMLASQKFSLKLKQEKLIMALERLEVTLFGSLAATGLGHSTDKAIILGLMGYTAETINSHSIESLISNQLKTQCLNLAQVKEVFFDLKNHLIFKPQKQLSYHPNAVEFKAYDIDNEILAKETYYSIGGGHILSETQRHSKKTKESAVNIRYPFSTVKELHKVCKQQQQNICEIIFMNECTLQTKEQVYKQLDKIIATMDESIHKGCLATGKLPGPLGVKRRAHNIFNQLKQKKKQSTDDPMLTLDWVNLYALAVNEENASGSKIVTAPTNGAAGIIPAVLNYYRRHKKNSKLNGCYDFLLTAGAIGILYMTKASVSGAEVGCQGEVGVACSMAAAGLTAALGGNNIQVEKAAEIGMEHNLGLTCDPIGGLVQIPCIERNAMASIKAINASRLALMTKENSHVSLDEVIATMYQTGLDMKNKYKETSLGGLAVNVKNC